MKYTIKIKKLTDWDEVKDSTLLTVGKKAIKGKEISDEWKEKMILARHSPIRDLMYSITIEGLPRWIADELRTHPIGVNPKMLTWRPDRGQVDRHEQRMDGATTYKMNLNAEAILNISEKRLCMCAAPGMISLWKDVLMELEKVEPLLVKYCVPACIVRCGCKESFMNCNYFKKFMDYVWEQNKDRDGVLYELTEMEDRYNRFNEWRKYDTN